MTRRSIFAILIAGLSFSACEQTQYTKDISNPSPYFINLVEGFDKSVFHGVDLCLSQDDVRKREKAQLYERTADHLFYNYVFPRDSTAFSEYADIQYFFDKNNTVEIITTNIFLNDSLQQDQLLQNFTQYFNNRYGDSKPDDYGYQVWNGTLETDAQDWDYSIGLTPMTDEYGLTIEYLRD